MKKYIVILIAFLALTSCSDVQKNERIITVSIEPLRFFTEEIAGNKFKVSTMVPEGMSPETYEPTAQQMMKLAQSDMFVKVGGIGFEVTWMKRMEANAPHTLVVNSSEGINEIKTSNGVSDPHTWMSTVNASIIAQNICNALIAIDQKDSLYFRQRLESLCEKIQATDLNVRKYLTKDKSKAFLIYHPTLTYFAKDYQLKQIPIEEHGREPSSAQTADIIQQAKKDHVKVMFVQKQFSVKNTRAITESVGATPVEINPFSYDWPNEMVNVAKSLK